MRSKNWNGHREVPKIDLRHNRSKRVARDPYGTGQNKLISLFRVPQFTGMSLSKSSSTL